MYNQIRIENYKGYKIHLWARFDKKKGAMYSYKVTLPTGELIKGKEYIPPDDWNKIQILDGLLRGLELPEIST